MLFALNIIPQTTPNVTAELNVDSVSFGDVLQEKLTSMPRGVLLICHIFLEPGENRSGSAKIPGVCPQIKLYSDP